MIHNNSNNIINSKPFFVPWANYDISFDALLGLTLTVRHNITMPIYLTYYKKYENHLELLIDCEVNGMVKTIYSLDTYLPEGISTLSIDSNEYLLGGTLTTIATKTNEQTMTDRVQISPMFIHRETVNKTDYTTINNIQTVLSNIRFNSTSFNIINKDNSIIELDNLYEVDNIHIKNDAPQGLLDNILELPYKPWYVESSTRGCNVFVAGSAQSVYCPKDIGETVFSPNNHSSLDSYPLDECFLNGAFCPERLDKFVFTSEELKLNELSTRHGDR